MDEEQVVNDQDSSDGDGGRRLLFFIILAIIVLVVLWLLLGYWDRGRSDADVDLPAATYVYVPDIVGLTEAEATAVLEGAGFAVESLELHDAYAEEGTVLIQSPDGGTETVVGITITIEVAVNRDIEGSAAAASDSATRSLAVPAVVGRMQESAESVIDSNGFVAIVSLAYDTEAPAGKVVAQYPAAGSTLGFGEHVNITVSLGSPPASVVQVPDVVSMSESAARTAVEARGLVLYVVPRPSPPASLDAVWQQWPEPGTTVEPGTQVTVIIGAQ